MEMLTSIVVDLEIIQKHETGGISTNMEREGMKQILVCIMNKLDIGEMRTDASSSIMRQVCQLKGMHHLIPAIDHLFTLDSFSMPMKLTFSPVMEQASWS